VHSYPLPLDTLSAAQSRLAVFGRTIALVRFPVQLGTDNITNVSKKEGKCDLADGDGGPAGGINTIRSVDMQGSISQSHPLRALFAELVQSRFLGTARLNDVPVARYVSGVLIDFCHVDSLYRIRNSRGKALEDVGEMLIASNPLLEGRSFIYEREVRKHIGDYTLFLAGLFPNTWRGSVVRRRGSTLSWTISKPAKNLILSSRRSTNLSSGMRRPYFGGYPSSLSSACSASTC
jgi:hypothetical protein